MLENEIIPDQQVATVSLQSLFYILMLPEEEEAVEWQDDRRSVNFRVKKIIIIPHTHLSIYDFEFSGRVSTLSRFII